MIRRVFPIIATLLATALFSLGISYLLHNDSPVDDVQAADHNIRNCRPELTTPQGGLLRDDPVLWAQALDLYRMLNIDVALLPGDYYQVGNDHMVWTGDQEPVAILWETVEGHPQRGQIWVDDPTYIPLPPFATGLYDLEFVGTDGFICKMDHWWPTVPCRDLWPRTN